MNYPIQTLQQLRPVLIGFRKQAGLSQAGLAAMLGITQQSYARIEANPAATSVERLFTVLRLLGGEIALKQMELPGQARQAAVAPALAPTLATSTSVRPPRKVVVAAPPRVQPPSGKTEDW